MGLLRDLREAGITAADIRAAVAAAKAGVLGAGVSPVPGAPSEALAPQRGRMAIVKTGATAKAGADGTGANMVGRLDGKTMRAIMPDTAATGSIAAADLGQAESAVDCIVWDGDALQDYRIGTVIGRDQTTGKLIVLAPQRGMFPVKLTHDDGGASTQGSKTTAAAFTYTVKNFTGDTLATAVSPVRSRPNGKFAAGTYGVAFYEGATLKLWDPGETPGTGGC